MKPTHARRQFTANRQFTDREDEQELFLTALHQHQAADEYRILSWYGVGGQGKSALSREFMRLADVKSSEVAAARINLDDPKMRRVENALLSIRLQLAQSFGHHFGAFDTAFARHFTLSNPGIDIRKRHPELFRGENPLLDDLLDWSEVGVDAVVEGVSLAVPGLNILYKYLSRFSARTREWFKRRGKDVLRGLDSMTADELLDRLPSYLGSDVCDLLDRSPRRCVVIVDTHEALWREHTSKDTVDGARADAWLRLFVQDAPGVLIVILGRDQLRWPEVDPDWGEVLESHLLGALSDEDADHFLQSVPITSLPVRRAIIAGAEGLPFYLDLQIDLFERLMMDGNYPSADRFGGAHPDILRRFLDHIGEGERNALRLASYPLRLTEAGMTDLAAAFLGGIGHLNWGQLTRYSFIQTGGADGVLMHEVMRHNLQSQERGERAEVFREVHEYLFESSCAQFQGRPPSEIGVEQELGFESALHHLKTATIRDEIWFAIEELKPFVDAARYGFLERTYGILMERSITERGEEHRDTLAMRHNRARQIGNLGRYGEAEAEFRAIWEIRRRHEALGEEHPLTLSTRHELAKQISAQGRSREAEAEFRTIWEIQRRPEALGEEHPETLTTRHNLAHEIGEQGHYGEAEAEFRAIWDIRRRSEALGEEHPETLTTRHNLAHQIGEQGRHSEAEAEFRAIWDIQRRSEALGEEHPETLTTRHNLARQIGEQSRFGEAEAEFRAIWEMLRRPESLGEEHPHTLATRHSLAKQIGQQRRYAEAEAEFRAIWEIWRRPEALGEEHPYTLRTRFYIAKMLDGLERMEEAEVFLEGLDSKLAKHMSANHLWRQELADYLERR